MGIEQAKVTLSYADLQELQGGKQRLEIELAEARDEIERLRLGAPDSDMGRLCSTLKDAISIVQFAVAHMDPRTVRGWPYPALRRIAHEIQDLPGQSLSTKEIASTWYRFCDLCQEWEDARAAGREQEHLAEGVVARGGAEFTI